MKEKVKLFKDSKIAKKLHDIGFRKKHYLILGFAVLYVIVGLYRVDFDQKGKGNKLYEKTSVHFIDVGQGDSSLIISGNEAILIDAGPTEASDNVVNYIKEQGISELSAVIVSHAHEDHIGGMKAIIENFDIKRFYFNGRSVTTKAYSDMLDALNAKSITPTIPKKGSTFELESGAKYTFEYPDTDNLDEISDLNDTSLVVRFEAARNRVLFTGDITSIGEENIIKSPAVIACDYIKIAHHGSGDSSTEKFLKRTGAHTAIISYGEDNSYGHPADETIQRLTDLDFEIRETAKEGTIVFEFEPNKEKKVA